MAHSNHISFFRVVGRTDHWAEYAERLDMPVDIGDSRQIVDQVVQTGRIPTGGNAPTLGPKPEEYLDIVEASRGGECIYLFQLDAEMLGKPRLKFVPDRPFIALPIYFEGEQYLLSDIKNEDGAAGWWASFSCDLDAVRSSRLADRIRSASEQHHHEHGHERGEHHHVPVLTIPFCLNVIDPVTGVSPWAFPRHTHEDERSLFSPFTHGGVHPPEAAYLRVRL